MTRTMATTIVNMVHHPILVLFSLAHEQARDLDFESFFHTRDN